MPSIFDFDQTVSTGHTFPSCKLEALPPHTDHYQLGKEHALVNIKKDTGKYLKHDEDNLSAIATWHNNPDYIAGYVATLIGKELTLEKTSISDSKFIAVNHYKVAGVSKPFLISYIPQVKIEFQKAITALGNKNQQIGLLQLIMLAQQLIQDDSIIDFYEDTNSNFQDAKRLPYIRSHLVERSDCFNILETHRMSPRKIIPVKPKDGIEKLAELQKAIAEAQTKYAAYHNDGAYKRWETAGWLSFFRHGSAGQAKAVQIKDQIGQCHNLNDALDYLDSHLTNSSTRYHRHSFASYLLDEVSIFANNYFKDRQLITCNTNKHYKAGDWTNALPTLRTLVSEHQPGNSL